MMMKSTLKIAAVMIAIPTCAGAQTGGTQTGGTQTRYRVALGPQITPRYPGADGGRIGPLVDVARAEGSEPYAFEAADESFGIPLFIRDRFSIGPSANLQGKRRSRDVGGVLPEVGFTVEIGGFVQYALTPAVRLRGEVRKGIGGHRGLIANVGADYVARGGDDWLFSVGPRVTLANDRFNSAYFDVTPDAAARSGLPVYDAGGGLQAVGVTAGYIKQFTPRWGVYGYAKYDRLAGDAADSPVVARYGSRNQLSGVVALTYSFRR